MENIKIRVKLSDIKPNMILAKDVVAKNGAIILAENTMLNNVNFTKLSSNDIQHVTVWSNSIENDKSSFTQTTYTIEEQRIPVKEKVEFKQFNQEYETKLNNAKECILEIGKTGNINQDNLYKIANDIVAKANCKSDVFVYLCNLKEQHEHTYSHCVNVSVLCNLFAKWIGMNEEDTKKLTIAGLLHDIGKTKISPELLNKKDALTPDEFDEIKKHTIYGYKIVEDIPNLSEDVKKAVLMHHEKIDGSGYPLKAKDYSINKFARIVSICDIYDAMTSSRVYRTKICPFEVIKSFEHDSFGYLDTKYLMIFLQNIAYTYVGTWVKLTNNQEAEIIFINRNQMSRPIVKSNNDFIDLSKRDDLNIECLI